MPSFVTGPWGVALVLLFALGAPLQLAVGGLVGMGRRVPALAALALPLLLVLTGLAGTVAGLEGAMAAFWNAADPTWAPWFALDDRARAAVPMGLGGLGAAILALPVALGAARVGVKARKRGLRATLVVAPGLVVAGGAGAAALLAALTLDGGRPLLLPAVGGPIFLLASLCASLPVHPRRVPAVTIGFGALVVGVSGLALGAIGASASGTAAALGDYSAPFTAMGGVIEATRAAWGVARVAGALAVGFVAVGFPVAAWRNWNRVDPGHGLDTMACAGLTMLALLVGAWAGARHHVLSTLAGAHAADVLAHSPGYAVPTREPIPTRVLTGHAATPRWLMMRARGGVERLPIAGGLDIVGPAVLRDDGLMLAPSLPMEDLYLALFESGAGSVSIIGCDAVTPELTADIARDPLLAVGRCAAFPLTLRVTTRLADPRVLIVLKDRHVDDHGDVVPITELTDLDGRDVIVRGQVDATVADLVALLHVLAPAGRVYLGHGVTLDGDDLPIGVDPGLRITRLPTDTRAPTGSL